MRMRESGETGMREDREMEKQWNFDEDPPDAEQTTLGALPKESSVYGPEEMLEQMKHFATHALGLQAEIELAEVRVRKAEEELNGLSKTYQQTLNGLHHWRGRFNQFYGQNDVPVNGIDG